MAIRCPEQGCKMKKITCTSKPKNSRKSQIWISAVLYVLVTAIIMVIVLEAGVPILKSMRDRSVFTQTKENFISLNQHINDISNAGPGSQRIIPIEIRKGSLSVDNNQIAWEMESKSVIQEPGTKIQAGDLILAAGTDVNAYKSGESLILENFYIKANFSSIGNETDYVNISTDDLINFIRFKDGPATTGTFTFTINDDSGTVSGTGYTKLLTEGYGLNSAELIAHINSTAGISYDLKFTIESYRDYLTVNLI